MEPKQLMEDTQPLLFLLYLQDLLSCYSKKLDCLKGTDSWQIHTENNCLILAFDI